MNPCEFILRICWQVQDGGPVKFEMAINLRTAKMRGLVAPPTLIARLV